MKNYSSSPYYDRYAGDTEHMRKGYTKVLAIPSRALQASEFNEIQSIQRDYTERLGKSIYKDGAIISGCQLSIEDNKVTIEDGQIFLDGLIRNVEKTTLNITKVGTERIIATLETTIVTATQDATLRDPAQGAENYNREGANRERQVVTLSVIQGSVSQDSNSASIYTLTDGEIVKNKEIDNYTFITDTLAERTFDENGNYKVEGINLQNVPEYQGNKIRVYVSAGKAYVRGYEVTKPNMSNILLDESTDTRNVTSESRYYHSTDTFYKNFPYVDMNGNKHYINVQRYQLSHGPVALADTGLPEFNEFTVEVQVIGEPVYRGSVRGTTDKLKYSPVASITSIYTKNSSGTIDTTFKEDRDYRLYSDTVDWSLTGDDSKEPTPNTTYYVDYTYNYQMQQGLDKDYVLFNDGDTAYLMLIQNGKKPIDGSKMLYNYKYTLARRDLILLDSNGNLSCLKGSSDTYDNLLTPYNGSSAFIELGYANIFPHNALSNINDTSKIAEIVNYDGVRLTQENFQQMKRRIETLESDVAQLDLERSLDENTDATSLSGYFTDNFENINKSDLTYTGTTEGKDSGVGYTACIDYDNKELTTSADILSAEMVIDANSSDRYAKFNFFKPYGTDNNDTGMGDSLSTYIGNIISAPYKEVKALEQPYATGIIKVNPYASYGPMCKVILNPNTDNWSDSKTIKINNTIENKTYTTDTKVYSHGYWSRSATHNLRARNFMRTETKTTTTLTGSDTAYNTDVSVATTTYEYMRTEKNGQKIEVTVTGQAFLANMKNIYALFNDKPISLHSQSIAGANKTVDGVSVSTVTADSKGNFTAKFYIPSNTPCGTASVKFVGDLGYKGESSYTANGTLLTTTVTNNKVVTDHYKVLTEVDNLYSSDPVAESFILDSVYDRNLIGADLYFATKSKDRDAIVQVRNIVNGYPGETVYAEVTVPTEKINIPNDLNVPVATHITFNQPVYCYAGKYYCIVVLSDSNDYNLYCANMGETILNSKTVITSNPYATGVMFSSSNASTWTAHQTSDLKLALYRSQYTGKGEIVFNNVNTKDVTGLLLDASYEVDGDEKSSNNRSTLTWYYKYIARNAEGKILNSDWLPIDTLVFRELSAKASQISLKAVINTDYSTSPFIDSNRISLRTFIDGENATYITKHLTETDFEIPYVGLKISYEACLPTGATMNMYYKEASSYDSPWIEIKEDSKLIDNNNHKKCTMTKTAVDEEFYKYTWDLNQLQSKATDSTSKGSKFFKFRIDLHAQVSYERPRIRKLAIIFKNEIM